MATIGLLLIQLLSILSWLVIAWVVISWLVAFNVINPSHPAAQNLLSLMDRIIHPIMAPIRRFIPPIGGIDIAPLVLIIVIQLLQNILYYYMVM